MDLISLRHALAVAEQTSFRRAGSALGVDASAVSRRVRALEDELGVSLFERHAGGARATMAGRRFLDRTRSALAGLDYAVKTASCAGGARREICGSASSPRSRRCDGYILAVEGEESGYPVYRLRSLTRGVTGAPKNLIFASNGPKPEIGFNDAINNDIVILSNAESCLIYDRPIRRDGLLWSELVDWWAAQAGGGSGDSARALGLRLHASLASDAERSLFEIYFRLYNRALVQRFQRLSRKSTCTTIQLS